VCKPSGISIIIDDDDDDDGDGDCDCDDMTMVTVTVVLLTVIALTLTFIPSHGSKFDSNFCWEPPNRDPTLGKPGTDGSFNFGIFGKPAKYQELYTMSLPRKMDCK